MCLTEAGKLLLGLYDDVTYMYDDVTYMYDDVTYCVSYRGRQAATGISSARRPSRS